ncbi:MAG TPA: protein phosphatase 2C domain-containing protein [Paracoccaceae bacterium]|nr:protein phosphatase 2C domain-containing protein [Paracoccaceae bacterium]
MLDVQFVFETGAASHPGRVRSHNEDCFLTRPRSGVWLVADGMGGHKAGDFASRTIVESVYWIGMPTSAHDLKCRFVDRLMLAHEDIRRQSESLNGATIGATVAALLAYERHFACIWAGDSRIYLMRNGTLHQMTTDHTEVNELLKLGTITADQAANWPRKNVITRAIGVFDSPETDENYGTLQMGDAFLLCSDGLTGHVTDEEIALHMLHPAAQEVCDRLIALTLERGARDNVTVIVVRCVAEESADDDERTRPGTPLVGVNDGRTED